MNKRFDVRKLTLTDFNPSEFKKASDENLLPNKDEKKVSESSSNDPVPEGRTTLNLNQVRGVVSSVDHQQNSNLTEKEDPNIISNDEKNEIHSKDISDNVSSELNDDIMNYEAPVSEGSDDSGSSISSVSQTIATDDIQTNSESDSELNVGRDERSAALYTRSIKAKKQSDASPEDSVPFNTRQPKWLKDKFFSVCRDKGSTPSIVIRNLMKSYCGLCLILSIFSFCVAKDSTFTTDQILSYFYNKTFAIKSVIPALKSSVAVRHAFWQTGDHDSTDYIYADRSNTRLEARVDIPILDLSYLKDRSKDKIELRAFVMKSLSTILSAQKSVNILETRSSSLQSRIVYLKNQVKLKLVNKSDLFPVEDQYYNILSQLYEAQSKLEQRIIDLSVVAGNDWLEAYKIIVNWDGKLFK